MARFSSTVRPGSSFVQGAVAEFIGTFFLVLIISTAVAGGSPLAPIGIGLGLTSLVFSYGYLSMAQYNPAVSVALFLAGAQGLVQTGAFIVVQLAGALLGGFVGSGLIQHVDTFPLLRPFADTSDARGKAFGAELLFTFALASTVVNVAVSRQGGNHFFGLAIGATVLAGAVGAGPISGGSFNPAVTVGLQMGALRVSDSALKQGPDGSVVHPISTIYLYLFAEVIGGLAAGLVYHIFDEPQQQEVEKDEASYIPA